jgi:hypothetical protein
VDDIVTATFVFDRTTLPFRTEFFLAGTRCLLSTNSHHILRLSVPWQSAQVPSGEPSFAMKIMEIAPCTLDAPVLPHFRGLGHLVFAQFGAKGFVNFDLLGKRAIGLLSSAAARDSHFWNTQLLPITIGLLGTTVGVAPLHCACLDRRGNGLLIAGDSGAGKSTLTAALAKRGFAVVSDDWTYVRSQSDKLVAHGMFAPLKLLPDTIRYFPELRDSAPERTLNGEIAHEVDPVRMFRSKVRGFSHPKWVLILERTHVPGCSFVPCRPEYLTQFFEKNAERLPQELSQAARTRSGIFQNLAACDCWILRTGEDPMSTAAAIDEFLPEV